MRKRKVREVKFFPQSFQACNHCWIWVLNPCLFFLGYQTTLSQGGKSILEFTLVLLLSVWPGKWVSIRFMSDTGLLKLQCSRLAWGSCTVQIPIQQVGAGQGSLLSDGAGLILQVWGLHYPKYGGSKRQAKALFCRFGFKLWPCQLVGGLGKLLNLSGLAYSSWK